MASKNTADVLCIKYLDVVIDCGVYKKNTAREVLKHLLTQSTISTQQFKFILSVQKSGVCRSLVHKALIKFKPLFDISSTCSVSAEPVHESSYEPYTYDEVLYACSNYIRNESYINFTKNYHAIFNEHWTIKKDMQQKFMDDLLRIISVFEEKKCKRPYTRRFPVRESLMFFIRYKSFNDFLRFQIFAIFKKGKLDDNVCREMLDSEVKWNHWRTYGFPQNHSCDDFNIECTSGALKTSRDTTKETPAKDSLFIEFMEREDVSNIASGDSAEWYQRRAHLFR
eukprot:jgi/Antlo1/2027/1006